ncbi:MAG: PAAR domain-containing protein [Stenotrophomonas sp.]|uniref:PAAR domain-containing protein n=1 Tax=Stenotrophomonas sp. TaxID=69392 RepID=UPI003D6D8365
MGRAFIVVGDKLDHGGSVISGASQTDINGKAVARKGDRAVCSRHGPTSIVSGDVSVLIDGQPVARDGDKTACGAALLASQTSTDVR